MSDSWQLAESFERTRRLISAINTVSIHTKLSLAGLDDPQPKGHLESATATIRGFLQKLADDVGHYEGECKSPVTGATARSNHLAKRFALSRTQARETSPLYSLTLPEFIPLLGSTTRKDQAALVAGLTTLRNLLEQHHHADSSRILGNI